MRFPRLSVAAAAVIASALAVQAFPVAAQTVPPEVAAAVERAEKAFGVKIKEARLVKGGLVELMESSGQIVYMPQDGSVLLVGELIDVETKDNLTNQRVEEISRFDPSTIPASWTFSVGNGPQSLWVFSDPKCPFCKRLEPELAKLKNVKIIYVPLAYQRSDEQVAAVLCARNKVDAWNKAIEGKLDANQGFTASCMEDVRKIQQFAQSKRIQGTPTMLRADGARLSGYTSAGEIQNFLAAANRK